MQWQRIPDLGRTLSAMTITPVTAASVAPSATTPRLEYSMFMFDSGAVSVRAYLSPSFNFSGAPQGLRYGISFDDETPQIINMTADSTLKAWEQSVGDNVTTVVSKHQLSKPGAHVLKFWAVDPGVVVQKLVIDAGGVKPSYLGPPESFRASKAVSRK